jgi:hypothetical protein
MARRLRIAVLEAAGYTPVGGDAPTPATHRELDALIRRHLPPVTATLFAEPRPSPDGHQVGWYSDLAGQPVRLDRLSAAEQTAARERLATRLDALDQLATRLRTDAPDVAARLEEALRYPGDDSVWVVGGEPVLTFWGHQAVGRPPLGPRRPEPVIVEPAAAPAVRRGGGRWLGAALVALLALGLLGWGLWHALGWGWWWPPWGPDYARLVAEAEADGATLASELATLEQALGERLTGCAADAALAAARTEGARLEGTAAALAERIRAAVAQCPPPEAEKKVVVAKTELAVPEDAAKIGNLDFLDGIWRVHQRRDDGELDPTRVAAFDRTPLVADYRFDAKGRGTRVITLDDGDRCTSSATATLRDGRLRIEAPSASCRSGKRSFNPASLKCEPASRSKPAQCWEEEPGVPDDEVWLLRVVK